MTGPRPSTLPIAAALAAADGDERCAVDIHAAAGIPLGSIGPALGWLHTHGWATRRTETGPHPRRPARIYYRITSAGTAHVAAHAAGAAS